MDYKGQADLMRRDAEEFKGPGHIIGDLIQGAKSITDLLSRAEAAEASAEKAEKCIAEIKSAREHARPSYVVDEILREFYDIKSFDELAKEAQKLYHDILTGEALKGEQHEN